MMNLKKPKIRFHQWEKGRHDDTLTGSNKADFLKGDQGNDYLLPSKGDDYLNRNKGVDVLVGGSGADMFQISLGNDTAEDFSIQEGDRIGLSSNGKYEIIEKPDSVIIKAITKMKLLLKMLITTK